MAELVQLREEISGNLQRLERVEQTGGVLRVVCSGVRGGGGAQRAAQTITDVGKQSHRGIKEKLTFSKLREEEARGAGGKFPFEEATMQRLRINVDVESCSSILYEICYYIIISISTVVFFFFLRINHDFQSLRLLTTIILISLYYIQSLRLLTIII